MKTCTYFICSLLGLAQANPLAQRQQLPAAESAELATLQLGVDIKQVTAAFYQTALSNFSRHDFEKSGHGDGYFRVLKDILFDETFHVALLSQAIEEFGAKPNQPCNYTFNFTSIHDFLAQASFLEGVNVDAFVGVSGQLQTPQLINNAEAILASNGMHNAIQRGESGLTILANPRGQALTADEVTTLLAPFILSCPSSNMVNSTAFPALSTNATRPVKQGDLLSFSIPNGTLPSTFFVTFLSGLNVKTSFPTSIEGNTFKAPVGSNMAGQTYVVVSNVNSNGTLNDTDILFGPTTIEVLPLPRNISAFDSSF